MKLGDGNIGVPPIVAYAAYAAYAAWRYSWSLYLLVFVYWGSSCTQLHPSSIDTMVCSDTQGNSDELYLLVLQIKAENVYGT